MSGLLFLGTARLDELKQFYLNTIGCELWLEQADCAILRHGNFMVGFCSREHVQNDAMLTFFFDDREAVDRMYERLKDLAEAPPTVNEKYRIYQFFARDPEGHRLEFQYFEDPMSGYWTGEDLLQKRRSVREYLPDPVSDEILARVFELCRFAPTTYNSQGYYFKLIRDRETIDWLATVNGDGSAPIGRAPLAIAIAVDPSASVLPVEDGSIATYHFLLAASYHGLGTCWIGYMNTDEVKQHLGIPLGHHLATVSPLGYPAGTIARPERKPVGHFVRD